MDDDLARLAREREIRYFLISYVDLFGRTRAKPSRPRKSGPCLRIRRSTSGV